LSDVNTTLFILISALYADVHYRQVAHVRASVSPAVDALKRNVMKDAGVKGAPQIWFTSEAK
jgi:hypothetical protein